MFIWENKGSIEEIAREVPSVYDRGVVLLSRAVVCINCETISETISVCPSCESRSLLSLAKILNREVG